MKQNLFAETSVVEVEIYFRCGDGFVSEHLLYCTEVCSTLQEVCGKRVSESVW